MIGWSRIKRENPQKWAKFESAVIEILNQASVWLNGELGSGATASGLFDANGINSLC